MSDTAHLPCPDFERDFSLDELLGGVNQPSLLQSLSSLLGTGVRLLGPDGEQKGVHGDPGDGPRHPLVIELEPVGYLQTAPDIDPQRLQAASRLLVMLLRAGARYQMASSLHLQAVQSDYEALQQKHAALQDSEQRYRDLAGQLEQRVEAQVQTIEQHQRQLYQAEKLASVGQLAAGVAHEINNPLGFIKSNLTTAKDYIAKLHPFAATLQAQSNCEALRAEWKRLDLDFVLEDFDILLDESIDGASRVAKIVSELKDFSRVDSAEEEVVDLNHTLTTVCNVARTQIPDTITLHQELAPLPKIRCHAGRLGQVFMNLLLNAIQATAKGGEIRLRSWTDGKTLHIQFIDTGSGITPDKLNRIFDPFYTSKDVGQGTGLGLTVSRDTIRAHGGDLMVESVAGQGSTFTITLPVRS